MTLQITLNGKPRDLAPNTPVGELLDQLRLDGRQVVVERNGEILPRQRFAETLLADGDTLEVVHFVGGG